MASYNSITLIGNLGQDPRMAQGRDGKIANISIATSKGKGDNKTTDWHRVVAYGNIAEVIEKYVKKGSTIMVEGWLTYREYTDTKGVTREQAEVHVNKLVLLGRADEGERKPARQAYTQAEAPAIGTENDDLPW